MPRSIAITGGAGFVGLALAEALRARGDTVHLLDITPPDAALFARPELAGTEFLPCDIMDAPALASALRLSRADLVIHAAAMTPNAETARTDAMRIVAINVSGALNVMAAAGQLGVRDVILLSSISVYGSRGTGAPELLETAAVAPDSLYGDTKLAAELLCARLAPDLGLGLVILRLGPLFGPWESTRDARPDLSPHAQILRRARAGLPVRLATPMCSDWVYSRDAAAMIAAVTDQMPRAAGQCFNIGAGRKFALADWAGAMGLPPPLIDADSPDIAPRAHPDRGVLSVAAITALTGINGARAMHCAVDDERQWAARPPARSVIPPYQEPPR